MPKETTETTEQPVALLDEKGNFTADFYDRIDDEDLRGNATLKQLAGQNISDGLRMLVHSQRKIGMNKIAVPQTDDDPLWNDVHKAMGKPDTPDDYPYKRPEGVPEEARNDATLKAMRERAHALNWSKKQWNAWIKQEDDKLIDDIKTRETNERGELDAADKKLKEIWGPAYNERLLLANRLINETVPEEKGKFSFSREDFIKQFGRDPMMIEWLAEHGKTLAEHEVLMAELSQQAPKEAKAELADLHASEDYKLYIRGELQKTNPSKAKAIEQRESELYEIMYPKKSA